MDTEQAIKKRMEQLENGMKAGHKRLMDLAAESEKMRQQILIFKGGHTELALLLRGVAEGKVADDTA